MLHQISGDFRLLRLDGLVAWESTLSASQFACCVFSTMFRVCVLTVLCGYAGAVAPDSCSGTVTTSFVGRKLFFCWDFAILGCYLFCLNFNFYSFQVLLLGFG